VFKFQEVLKTVSQLKMSSNTNIEGVLNPNSTASIVAITCLN
jgi:hypothetical protein